MHHIHQPVNAPPVHACMHLESVAKSAAATCSSMGIRVTGLSMQGSATDVDLAQTLNPKPCTSDRTCWGTIIIKWQTAVRVLQP